MRTLLKTSLKKNALLEETFRTRWPASKMRCAVAIVIALAGLAPLQSSADPISPMIELGSAGPGNWSVLAGGNFSLSDPNGFIHGNVGEATGNFTDGGSAGVSGSIYLGTGVGHTTVTGDTGVTASTLPSAALTQANVAAAYYNGLTPNFTAAPSAGAVAAGVYDISGDWSPNGGTYTLAAGQIYIFNISGDFKPNTAASALFFNDSTPWDVLFNVGGKVQTSGGSSTYPMLDGILLAQGSISLTPGYVDGEIISQSSINIASKGAIQGQGAPSVPDGGATFLLLGSSAGCVFQFKRKLVR